MDTFDPPTVFGRSLRLTDGDLPIAAGGFPLIAGRDNLLQGLRVMIDTPLASDIFNVRYGFDILAALASPHPAPVVKELIRLTIVRTLSTDDRIQQIREIVFDDEPRFFELSPDSDREEHRRARQASRRWHALVVVQTITEGPVMLAIQGAGV